MTIRVKFAAIITLGTTAAILAAVVVFVTRQYAEIRRAEVAERRIMMESVANLAHESLLAKDPLMLLDYLAALQREHEEVVQ